MNADLAWRIWQWLPGRTDGRRVTLPSTISVALDADYGEVTATVHAMERAGHAVRDAATGRQTGWHRGTPPPSTKPIVQVADPDPMLF